MAYGMEVTNADGRTVFSSSDPASTFTAGTATSLTGYNKTLPTLSTGQLLLLRPLNNTSATIATEDVTKTLGSTSNMQTFAQASGAKYRIAEIATELTPSTSGYGLEVFNNSSEIIFTSEAGAIPEILAFGEVSNGQVFTFDSPGTVPFNEIYVVAPTLKVTTFFGTETIRGSWATFNDSNETIEITASTFWTQYSQPMPTGVAPNDGIFRVRVPFLIFGVRT
tara:strand:+ start:151 stop:819 length:669 start_codon:yes stop_codon:yes gene_type:complete